VGQQHTVVVLHAGVGQLLDGDVVGRVLVEECAVLRILGGVLADRDVTGLAGPVAGVGGVGEEVDELDGVVLTLLGDAGGDAQACAAGRAGALTGGVRQGCHSPVEGGGRLDGGQAAGGLDAGTDDAGGELVGDVGGDGGPALVDGGL